LPQPPGGLVPASASSEAQGELAQTYKTVKGQRALLLVDTDNASLTVTLPSKAKKAEVVDTATGESEPRIDTISGETYTLAPFATAVVTFDATSAASDSGGCAIGGGGSVAGLIPGLVFLLAFRRRRVHV
jgi:hypothetical protein